MSDEFDASNFDELGRRIPQIGDPEVQVALQAQAAARARAAAAQVQAAPPIPGPFIAERAGTCWVRASNSLDFSRKCSVSDLRLVVKEVLRGSGVESLLKDEKGRLLSAEALLLSFGMHVQAFELDYTARQTTFESKSGTLHEGFRIPEGEAAHDQDVADFLLALTGGPSADDDLSQWIMSCRADMLDTPAAALILVGPPGVGKTLITTVLARMWGNTPVSFKSAMSENRFQSELLNCPILSIEESFPKGLTQSEFSDIVQSRSRRVERKGVDEKVLLHGCFRIVACVNDLARVRFVGSGGADAVNALADRLAVFEIRDEQRAKTALEKLKIAPHSPHVDLERFARHFRWIQRENPRPQRFLGARTNNRERSAAVVLAGEVEKSPELFDFIREFCERTQEIERGYLRNVSFEVAKGKPTPFALKAFSLIVHNGEPCAYPKALAAGFGLETKEVRTLLKPFQVSGDDGRTEVQFGGQRARYMRLDAERLLRVLAPDSEDAGADFDRDTADRLVSVPLAQQPMSFDAAVRQTSSPAK